MNYKKIVLLEREERSKKDSDKFFFYFLGTIHMVQIYSKMLKGCNPIVKDAIKHRIKDDVKTLKCFVDCLK